MGFVPFTFIDLIDILFVAYIMYWIYRTTKGTNAPYIISGIIVVYLLWVIVKTLNMELLSTILGHIISVGAIALIVVFQPEIRRFLQKIGMSEISDAIILVVSEETGAISIANNGRINLNIPSDRLGAVLQKYLISKK